MTAINIVSSELVELFCRKRLEGRCRYGIKVDLPHQQLTLKVGFSTIKFT